MLLPPRFHWFKRLRGSCHTRPALLSQQNSLNAPERCVSEHRPELGTVQLFAPLTSLSLPHVPDPLTGGRLYFCTPPSWLWINQVTGTELFQYRHTQHGSPDPISFHFHTSILILLYPVIHSLLLNETYSV